jgi:hypothetical protein
MYEYTDKITKISRLRYDAKFKIDQKTAEMATFIVVSYPEIKKYLNKKFGLQMYIQDEK